MGGSSDIECDLPDAVRELPPTARFVYHVLAERGWVDQPTLATATGSPQRTVRHALGQLDAAGVLESRWVMGDTRSQEYRVTPTDPSDAAGVKNDP